jgi:hypothetical protein
MRSFSRFLCPAVFAEISILGSSKRSERFRDFGMQREVVEGMRALRKRVKPSKVRIREMVAEGRRL